MKKENLTVYKKETATSNYFNRFINGSFLEKVNLIKKSLKRLACFPFIVDYIFKRKLKLYLKTIKKNNNDQFIFMFSGTPLIKNFEGNRPIRLTKEFINMHIPVFFSYWRWSRYETIPSKINDLLFQSPIDLTLKYINQIIEYNYSVNNKTFIFSFPHPSCIQLTPLLKEHGWRIIYDIRDDWEEFHKVGQAVWYEKNIEMYLIKNSDIVCAVSKTIIEKMNRIFPEKTIFLTPNALDPSFVNKFPLRLAPRNGPIIIGYIGHLTDAWFDWNSLLDIAQMKPHWIFEIIGHSMPSNLSLPPNIHYLGEKTHKEIIKLTKNWRVGIIPFKVSPLSDAVDPIKVYEYLALGIPVVSFRMPQIGNYPYVFIANNNQEFIKKIELCMSVDLADDEIRIFLEKNSWEKRAQQFANWGKKTKRRNH